MDGPTQNNDQSQMSGSGVNTYVLEDIQERVTRIDDTTLRTNDILERFLSMLSPKKEEKDGGPDLASLIDWKNLAKNVGIGMIIRKLLRKLPWPLRLPFLKALGIAIIGHEVSRFLVEKEKAEKEGRPMEPSGYGEALEDWGIIEKSTPKEIEEHNRKIDEGLARRNKLREGSWWDWLKNNPFTREQSGSQSVDESGYIESFKNMSNEPTRIIVHPQPGMLKIGMSDDEPEGPKINILEFVASEIVFEANNVEAISGEGFRRPIGKGFQNATLRSFGAPSNNRQAASQQLAALSPGIFSGGGVFGDVEGGGGFG